MVGVRGRRRTDPASPDREAPGSDALTLPRAPERARLYALERQQERLLRDVAKKKEALAAMQVVVDDVMSEFFKTLSPLRQEVEDTLGTVRRVFEGLLNESSSLKRRDKKAIANAYADLLSCLPLELLIATELEITPSAGADDASTGEDPWPAPFDSSERGAQDSSSFAGNEEAASLNSLPTGNQAAGLRPLFKRLVVELHPDKVRDAAAKSERTAVLRAVTQAYQSGDLAKLLEIERGLALEGVPSTTSDALVERVKRLLKSNTQLRAQLRSLTAARKTLRDELPFRLDLRAPKRLRAQAAAQTEELLASMQSELKGFRELRDFVQRFAEGKMSLRDFLLGPGASEVEAFRGEQKRQGRRNARPRVHRRQRR